MHKVYLGETEFANVILAGGADSGSSEPDIKRASGTADSATAANQSVFVKTGFSPDRIFVTFYFTGTDTETYMLYDKAFNEKSNKSCWTIPTEGNTYLIDTTAELDSNVKSGIIRVTDNGFYIHSHGENTINTKFKWEAMSWTKTESEE